MTSKHYYHFFDSPVGQLRLLLENTQVMNIIGLDFAREQFDIAPQWQYLVSHPVIEQTKVALAAYFSGEKNPFSDLPLKLFGTEFQCQVWWALLTIPFGTTATYADIAKYIGRPNAARAVGGAVGRNPIIIPCHRILGKNGRLTGFGGGLPIKRQLLQHENIPYLDQGIEFVKPKRLSHLI